MVQVTTKDECPSHTLTTSTGTPFAEQILANVWRRSWTRSDVDRQGAHIEGGAAAHGRMFSRESTPAHWAKVFLLAA